MEKIYERSEDLNVRAIKVFAKTSDPYAYADQAFTTKISADELQNAFIKGMIVVDSARVIYKPISCKVANDVATVTYATTDTSSTTTAKLATVKSA